MIKPLAIALLACGATAAHATMWNLVSNMNTAQHGLTGPGTGVMTGTYDDVTNVWTILSMSGSNLTGSVSISHLHTGAAGVSGGPIVDLGSTGNGSWAGSGGNWTYVGPSTKNVGETSEAAFLSGGTYINIHTQTNPGGEVRGQVIATAVPEPATMALLGLSALAFARRRRQK